MIVQLAVSPREVIDEQPRALVDVLDRMGRDRVQLLRFLSDVHAQVVVGASPAEYESLDFFAERTRSNVY